MTKRHEIFDEDALNIRKSNFMGYAYCPLCRQELIKGNLDGCIRVYCPDDSCGFVFYQNPTPAAGAVVVKEREVLLVKRAHPPRVGWWCLPAGFMEWQEHPEETAVREVREETGLDIKLTAFFQVYVGRDDPRTNAVLILYLADVIGGELQADDDALEVKYFPLNSLPDKIAFESHQRALQQFIEQFC